MADRAQRGRKPMNEPAAKATTATMRAENTLAIWEREPEAMPAAVRDMEAEHGGQPMRPTNALARPKVRISPSGDGAGASPAENASTHSRDSSDTTTAMAKAARSSATMSRPSGSTVAIWGSVPDTCGRKTMGSPAAASPLHSRAAATSTTMAEGTFGKKRFRRYMPAMHRADTTAQAHEAPGRHETMAATFDTMVPEVSAVVPRSSGIWPMTTVIAMPNMNPCMTGSGMRRMSRPAPAQPSSRRNSAVRSVSRGMAATTASWPTMPAAASIEAVMAAAAESMPKTTRRVPVSSPKASGATMEAHRP